MKKFIPILFFTFALILLSACNREGDVTTDTTTPGGTTAQTDPTTTGNENGNEEELKDGVYTIDSDPWDEGYERVIVTVEDGKITDVEFLRFDAEGSEIELTEDDEHYAIRDTLRDRIIETQTADDLEDLIDEATTTTENWLKGIRDAFKEAGRQLTGGNGNNN